jgi:hypothetical protein
MSCYLKPKYQAQLCRRRETLCRTSNTRRDMDRNLLRAQYLAQ